MPTRLWQRVYISLVTCTISNLLDIRRVLSHVNLRKHPPRHALTLQKTRSRSFHPSAGALVRANRRGTPADGWVSCEGLSEVSAACDRGLQKGLCFAQIVARSPSGSLWEPALGACWGAIGRLWGQLLTWKAVFWKIFNDFRWFVVIYLNAWVGSCLIIQVN